VTFSERRAMRGTRNRDGLHARVSLRSIDLLVIGLIAALSSSCGGGDVVADARIQAPRLGEASPPQSKPYAFSRSERIERVVGKLLGNTSNAAWNQSKELLAREEDPTAALLRSWDEQRLRSGETAGLRNAIQVMGRSEESAYGAALLGLESHPAQKRPGRSDACPDLLRRAAGARDDGGALPQGR
jgi:hypothetical protein